MDLKNIRFAGIYLQKVMPNIEKKEEAKEDKLKLEGYSNSDKDIIEKLDSSYENSNVIKSLKTKADGAFTAHAKVLDDNKFNKLKDYAKEHIDKVIDNILESKFDISPIQKENDKEITACKYCNYKDICFRVNSDIRNLKKDKELSFLGGDQND